MNREQTFEHWFISSKSVVMWTAWNKLYTRELIGDTRFNDITPGQDQDFNLRIYLKCKKTVVTNQVLYNWFVRSDSITGKYSDEATPMHINILRLVDFNRYAPMMTEAERGYMYTRIMMWCVKCRYLANGNTKIKASLKNIVGQTKRPFFGNKTIGVREKSRMFVLLKFPFIYNLYERIKH